MVDRIHGGNLEEIARKYDVDFRKIIDFSSNINPYGPPKAVIDYLSHDNLKDVADYPDINCTALKSALAKKLDLSVKNLMITNGSSEAINLLANHFCPQKALIFPPTFCEYEVAVLSIGGEVKKIKLQKEKNFAFSFNSILSELEEAEMIFLCNPNNPTGNLYSRNDLLKLLKEARGKDVFCVVDEAFMDFVEDKEGHTLKPLVNDFDNLAVLGSLTKFYSLAGLRVGYIVSNESLVFKLKNKVSAWNVNGFAQKAAVFALEDEGFEKITLEKNIKARDKLSLSLGKISGLKVYPSRTNFLLVEATSADFSSENFYADLLKRGFYVRNCASFDGLSERFFRVAIRSEEENSNLFEAIEKVLLDVDMCESRPEDDLMIPRIIIAGTHSGVGKTSVAIGLMASLKKRGFKVQPFKVGPDYIDPRYHEFATGKKSRNLDSWMMGKDVLPEIFLHGAKGSDICVIEGVMGLFDGYDGTNEVGSTAEIAKILNAPVILVVDAGKMARSVAALVKGYVEFDKDLNIEGVILNNIGSKGHYEMVKSAIEKNLDLKVLGYLPRNKELNIPERHLGLVVSHENLAARETIKLIAKFTEKFLDVDSIVSVAQRAFPIEAIPSNPSAKKIARCCKTIGENVRLAVAMDEAFFFYYPENLELFESLGVEIVSFSPINDRTLPLNIHGIYIGGGYPELFARVLEKNISMRNTLKTAIENDVPTYAECGGLMYLTKTLIDQDGETYEMVGAFPAVVKMKSKLVSLGYIDIKVGSDNVLAKEGWRLRGHEFRWSDIEVGGEIVKTYLAKKKGERKLEGYAFKNLLASYIHLHFSAKPQVVERFVMKMKKFKEEH